MIGFIVSWAVVVNGAVQGIRTPVIGAASYYWLAILRPELFWFWAFGTGGNSMSKIVAGGTLIGFFLSGGLTAATRLRQSRLPFLGLVAFLLCGLYGATVVAENPITAWTNLVLQFKISLMAFVAVCVCRNLKGMMIMLSMVLFGLLYFAWELNVAWVRYHSIPRYLESLHGDNNNISLLMVFAVPFGLASCLVYRSMLIRSLVVIGVFASIHAILFLESRGAYVALAVALFLCLVWAIRTPQYKKVAFVAVFAGLIFIAVFAGERVVNEWESIFADTEERDASAQSRIELAKIGWTLMTENPLGLGPRQSPLEMPRFGMPKGKLLHNLYLQVGSDYGFLGLFGYMSFYLLAAWNAYKVSRMPIASEEARRINLMAVGCTIGIVGFLTGGMFLSCERIEIGIIGGSLALMVAELADRRATDPKTHLDSYKIESLSSRK